MFFEELSTKEVVKEEDAYAYALDQITNNEKEKQEFIEWFFSGNWIKVKEDEE